MFKAARPLVRHVHPASQAAAARVSLPARLHAQTPLVQWQRAHFSNSRSDRADTRPPKPQIDREAERKIAQKKLESDPSAVSTESTTHKAFAGPNPTSPPPEDNVNDGIKHDIGIVRDTFDLGTIPRKSYLFGLAGTIPYLATSLSTVYLGWDLSKALPTGSAFYDSIFINHETAQYLLSIMEPLQLGYGAVIISFLGAIHWGLEFAEKKPMPERTRFRYGIGVAASVVAWPTVLMPIEYGLTSQFMTFVALYFADARASTRGWAPTWYGQYRFMLTAVVGLAIFVSLVGRSQIEKSERLSKQHLRTSMNRPGIEDTETDWAKVEAEDKKKMKKEQEEKERKAKQEEEKKSEQEQQKGEGDSKKGEEDSKKGEEDSNKGEEDSKNGEDEKGSKDTKNEEDGDEKKSG